MIGRSAPSARSYVRSVPRAVAAHVKLAARARPAALRSICLDRVVEDSDHRARYLLRALWIEAHGGVPDNLAQRGPH